MTFVKLHLVLTLLLSNIAPFCYSQNEQYFKKLYGIGYPYSEHGMNIIALADGNYLMLHKTGRDGCIPGIQVFGALLKITDKGDTIWYKEYSNYNIDTVSSVYCERLTIADSGKSYVVVGYQRNIQSEIETGNLKLNSYILKTDSSGNIIWEKIIESDSIGIHRIFSVKQTHDKGFILAGKLTYSSGPDYDGLAIKIGSSGNVEWQKTFGEKGQFDLFADVVIVDDSNYIFTGSKNFNLATGDIWVVKTDQNGNVLQNTTYSGIGSSKDVGEGIINTKDRGFIISGITYPSSYGDVGFLLKLDSTLKQEWLHFINNGWDFLESKIVDSSYYDNYVLHAKQTKDGNYVAAGTAIKDTIIDSWGISLNQIFLVKINGEKNINESQREMWRRVYTIREAYTDSDKYYKDTVYIDTLLYPDSFYVDTIYRYINNDEFGYNLDITDDGDILLTGRSDHNSWVWVTDSTGYYCVIGDAFLIKVNCAGDFENLPPVAKMKVEIADSASQINLTSYSENNDLIYLDLGDGILPFKEFSNLENYPYPFNVNGYTYQDTGTYIITLVAISSCLNLTDTIRDTIHITGVIGEEEQHLSTKNYLKITPNPFNQSTTISYFIDKPSPNSNLSVFDVTGKMVKSFKLAEGNNNITVSANEFNSGIYYCKLIINGTPQTGGKMIVLK